MAKRYENIETTLTNNPIEISINEVFDRIIECANRRRNEIITEIKQRSVDKQNESAFRGARLKQLADVKGDLTNREMEFSLKSMQGRMVGEIESKIDALQVMEREMEIGFDCDTKQIEDAISKLGELIERDISVPDYATLPQPNISFGKEGIADAELKWPGGLAFSEISQLIYVGNGGCAGMGKGRISVFSMKGEYIGNFCDGLLKEPVGIALYEDEVFVSDTYLNCVFKLNLPTFKLVKKAGTNGAGIGEFDCPQKLSLDSDGNVYVADCGNNRVVVLSNDLTHKLHIQHMDMKFPYDVKVNQSNIYILSLTDDPCLHVFSQTGEKLHSFITCGITGDTQVKQCYTFCFDRKQNIIFGDHAASDIKVFSRIGELMHAIGGKKIGRKTINPSSILVTDDSKIICISSYTEFALHIF